MKKVVVFWIASLLLIACSRQSSKLRLEAIAEISLPDGYTVLLDDYQKAGKDFYIQYNLQFNKDSTLQLVDSIKSSKYYSKNGAQVLYDSVWYEDKNLYKFEAMNKDKKYTITFDPSSGLLHYMEYSEEMKL